MSWFKPSGVVTAQCSLWSGCNLAATRMLRVPMIVSIHVLGQTPEFGLGNLVGITKQAYKAYPKRVPAGHRGARGQAAAVGRGNRARSTE